jgi:hypothetical protein
MVGCFAITTLHKEGGMKHRILVVCAALLVLVLTCSATCSAQQAKWDRSSNSSPSSRKTVSVAGRVGTSGKTFVGDKHGGVWTVENPEILLAAVGNHVTLWGRLDPQTHALHVVAVEPDPSAGSRLEDTAFRR